jgi:hypothetical protein
MLTIREHGTGDLRRDQFLAITAWSAHYGHIITTLATASEGAAWPLIARRAIESVNLDS